MKQLIRKYFLVGALLIGASTQAATIGLTAITVNGDKMVNDSVLGVTWADVVPTCENQFGNCVGFYSSRQWVEGLNTALYGGHNDWRLATLNTNGLMINNYQPPPVQYIYTNDPSLCIDGSLDELGGCLVTFELPPTAVFLGFDFSQCTFNSFDELGCLFANELGNTPGLQVTNLNPFTSFSDDHPYCSGTELALGSGVAWMFHTKFTATYGGYSCRADTFDSAIAVRTGLTEVAPVPVPASAWLLLSGLGGLGLMSRKRKTLDK